MSLEYHSGNPIHNVPLERQQQYSEWANALEQNRPGAEAKIRQKLNDYVDQWLKERDTQGVRNPQFCSSWIPGRHWGEAYQSIYETMMNLYQQDHEMSYKAAGWFFGLILMDVMIQREGDHWECWHERQEDSFAGLFYRPLQVVFPRARVGPSEVAA
jgi:hypothetical protein